MLAIRFASVARKHHASRPTRPSSRGIGLTERARRIQLTTARERGQHVSRLSTGPEAGMPLNTALILLAALAQMFFTFYVYLVLIRGRIAAVSAKVVKPSTYVLVEGEPSHLARRTNNLRNQFELPVLFYALVLMLVAINRVTMIDVILAWVFVAARIAHYVVHTESTNIALRPRVFAIGMTIVGLLALHALVIVLGEMLR
jgi:hypothetical protein